MTPPTFRIGDLVKVVGQPYGLYTKPIGQKARITKIEPDSIGQLGYEVDGVWWYPASSLRLVEELKIGDYVELRGASGVYLIKNFDQFGHAVLSVENRTRLEPIQHLRKLSPSEIEEHLKPELKIGDWVEVIGPIHPSFNQCDYATRIFRIGYTCCDKKSWYSEDTGNSPGYPPESLRKLTQAEIEEHLNPAIKVGDWVQVIPSADEGSDSGKIFQIKEPRCNRIYFRTKDTIREYWPVACLRKLTPEEVLCHLTKLPEVTPEGKIHERLNWLQDQMDNLRSDLSTDHVICHQDCHVSIDRRLSAIEERQYKIEHEMKGRTFDKTPIAEILKRLDSIEAFQKDEAKQHAFVECFYETGTIIVHCPCGRTHEIEATPHKTKSYTECFMESMGEDET